MEKETSDERSKAPVEDGSESQEDCARQWQPFQNKPKRLRKDGTPYKPRKGWGPYRSVPRERAVAFNLQLDVQNLQQHVHELAALRDVLQTKRTLQRQELEDSLLQQVNEFFRFFRTGSALGGSDNQEQHEFLNNFVDHQVELSDHLRGPDALLQEIQTYSALVGSIRLEMNGFRFVTAEDTAIVSTDATLHFQLLQKTVDDVCPEALESQLVDKEVEMKMNITFYFNADSKCCKFDVGMDLVRAFATLLKDLDSVNTLLSRALTTGCIPTTSIKERTITLSKGIITGTASQCAKSEVVQDGVPLDRTNTAPASKQSYCWPLDRNAQRSCLRVVDDYYLAFANGFIADHNCTTQFSTLSTAFQRDFLLHRFAATTTNETTVNHDYVEKRWRSLSECFEVQSFSQQVVTSLECLVKTCLISSSALYTLRITPATILSVFPHVLARPQLHEALVGRILTVPSEIHFTIESDTRRILRIDERMDFAEALGIIVTSEHELRSLLSEARLGEDGVACRSDAATRFPHEAS